MVSEREAEAIIGEARGIAEEKGVPLTLGRVLCGLGWTREEWRLVTSGRRRVPPGVRRLCRRVEAECAAAVLEYGLGKGGNATLTAFILKNEHGYTDAGGEEEEAPTVVFVNGDRVRE